MSKLYTPRLLSLAAELADYPYTEPFQHSAEVRSRTCGSVLLLGADLDSEGRVERIGTQVTACAVGQSAAAIMVAQAAGKSAEEFAAAIRKQLGTPWTEADAERVKQYAAWHRVENYQAWSSDFVRTRFNLGQQGPQATE